MDNFIVLQSFDNFTISINYNDIKKYIGEQFIMFINEGNNVINLPVLGYHSLLSLKSFFNTGEWLVHNYVVLNDNIKKLPFLNKYYDIHILTIMEFLGLDTDMIICKYVTRKKYEEFFNESSYDIQLNVIVDKLNNYLKNIILTSFSAKLSRYKKDVQFIENDMGLLFPDLKKNIIHNISYVHSLINKSYECVDIPQIFETIEHLNKNIDELDIKIKSWYNFINI